MNEEESSVQLCKVLYLQDISMNDMRREFDVPLGD